MNKPTQTPDDLSHLGSLAPGIARRIQTARRLAYDEGYSAGFASGYRQGQRSMALFDVEQDLPLPTPIREAEEGQPQFIGRILTNSLLPEVSNGGCQG